MMAEPRKMVLRRPKYSPSQIQAIAPQKHPTLYDATEIPWTVDTWFAWLWVKSVLVVSISGKTDVNEGRVNRPPVTVRTMKEKTALIQQLTHHALIVSKQPCLTVSACTTPQADPSLQEIQTSDNTNSEVQFGATKAQVAAAILE